MQWLNDLDVAIPLGDQAYTQPTLAQQQEMFDGISKGHYHVFTIVTLEGDEPIGRCLLFDIDQVNRQATLGIFIGKQAYWGQGYGQDAIALLLDYGFNLLNLNNIMLGTVSFNERAINCYKKVGFKEIGRRREARIIGEKKYDAILMDILAAEFESPYVRKLIE
jgi:RimJ/RimL family protein N-acetyltransferase